MVELSMTDKKGKGSQLRLILLKDTLSFEKGEIGEMLAAWINDRGLSNIITLFIQERVIDPLN